MYRNKIIRISIFVCVTLILIGFIFTIPPRTSAQGQTSLPVLPEFLLPYPSSMNGKVFFTGGPHDYNQGKELTAQYAYGQGTGLDFAGGPNQKTFPVVAMASGWITKANCTENADLGCIISIKHDIGTTYLTYAHLDPNSTKFKEINSMIARGQSMWVDQGTWIGDSGCSGTGAYYDDKCHNHLHIELRNNSEFGDPLGWESIYYGGQVNGYWIWGYGVDNMYGSKMYNYDGVAVKGESKWITNFRYYDMGPLITNVCTKVGINYFCPTPLLDCENNKLDPNTQFAKTGSGGDLSYPLGFEISNLLSTSETWDHGVLISTNTQSNESNDDSTFMNDVSLPDGSYVYGNQILTKTWRLKNTGAGTWGSGYKLVFISGEQMGGPNEIDVPSTSPGQEVDLSVNLLAPSNPGGHTGYWQLRNPQKTFFGDKVWVKINVQAQNSGGGNITVFDVSPASPSSADQVHIVGRIRPFTDFRSMRFVIGNEYHEMPNLQQIGDQLEISLDWQTGSLPRGNYAILFELANNGDLNWSNPERRVITYTLDGSPISQNRPPNRPVLNSPYNWYLKDNGGSPASVELCVNPSSDPDGNPVNYWFEVEDQGGGVYANSGWTSSTCWERTYDPNTYSWRVKAGDGSAESDWSAETWNFTVAKGGVYIGDITFFNINTYDTHICVPVNYDGILAPQVYAWLNKANDGSETGEWRLLDHYGPNTTPDCTEPNMHGFWIRSPEYETGVHMLRVNAVKKDSGSNQTKTSTYTIAYILPSHVNLLAPSTQTNNGTWWNTGTINFQWSPSLRIENYNLRVSTDSNPWTDPNPLLDVTLPGSQTSISHTFSQDFPKIYWSVRAINSAGATDSSPDVWFGIDHVAPTCQVQPLPTSTYENVFQVNWSGTDDSSGMLTYDVQYKDSERGDWKDWITNQSAARPYELFNGQPGHVYYFRCRGTDSANNTPLDYPPDPDAWIKVDPQARPPEPWWNSGYSFKRNLTIQNNMAYLELPAGYPVLLHFSTGTSPTAAEIFNSSTASQKCADIRIVHKNSVDLPLVIDKCTSEELKIWFRTQEVISNGGIDNTNYQIYYGNSNPASPAHGRVFYPDINLDSLRVYDMREGTGYTLIDATGHSNASMNSALGWTQGKWGPAVQFPTDDGIAPRPAIDDGAAYMPTNSFTVEFWLKRGPVDGGTIAHQVVNGYPTRWSLQISDGKLLLKIWPWSGAGASEVKSERNLNDPIYYSQFHHYAVTFDGQNQVRFYIDGQLESSKTLSQTGLAPSTSPLRIGASDINTARLSGVLFGFSLSEEVKTEFPYGYFATITSEPLVLAGQIINPPSSGEADLVVQTISTYPNPGGGVLVEAQIQNQGTMSTQNGFFTDLYFDHVPTGSGDFTGSLQFWVNDSIEPGATAVLSTVVNYLISTAGLNTTVNGSFSETSGMVYAQTDSTGALIEENKENNIFSTGAEICVASPDINEDDNIPGNAVPVLVGQATTHNFDAPADNDWIKFNAQAGRLYYIETTNLGLSADTYLYLYDLDGATLLTSNDDNGGTLASRIGWVAPLNGTYYIMVSQWNPSSGGCGTGYTVGINEGSQVFLPLVNR